MSSRSEYAAVSRTAETLRQCLSCVTSQPFQLSERSKDSSLFTFSFQPRGRVIRLTTPSNRLYFSVVYAIRAIQPHPDQNEFVGEVVGYEVTIGLSENTESLAYHWHRAGVSRVRTPHLHVSSPIYVSGSEHQSLHLGKMHLPTGFVSIAAIVRLLIQDFRVQPSRTDWDSVLTERGPKPIDPS